MPEQANPNVEGAIKERAALYLAVFRELTKRYGEDEAVDVLSTVSKTIGTAVGENLSHHAPRDFAGLLHSFFLSPDDGATFKADVRRVDDTVLEIKMMACPLKEGWLEAGCSEAEVCTLLQAASSYDRAVMEAAGFGYELELWEPGKAGCCLSLVRERSD